jgi:hypothetical protein
MIFQLRVKVIKIINTRSRVNWHEFNSRNVIIKAGSLLPLLFDLNVNVF